MEMSRDFEERNNLWDSLGRQDLEDQLDALDDRWYAAEREFLPTLRRYVHDYPDEFSH